MTPRRIEHAKPHPVSPTLLRRKAVEQRTGLSRTHIYALMKQGAFPQSVPLAGRAISIEDLWETNYIPTYVKHADEVSRKRFKCFKGEDVELTDQHHLAPDSILQEHGIEGLRDDPKLYMQFCESALRMLAVYYERRLDLNRDARTFNVGSLNPGQQSLVPPSEEQLGNDDLLSEVAEKYRNELMVGENWKPQTHGEQKSVHDELIEAIGDRPITAVDNKAAQYFKTVLQRLPSKRTTRPKYRDCNIDQLLKMNIPTEDKRSVSTVNKYIGMISSLMNWAVKNGYVSSNPFAGIKLKEKVQAQDKRLPFSDDDLVALFISSIFTEGKCKHIRAEFGAGRFHGLHSSPSRVKPTSSGLRPWLARSIAFSSSGATNGCSVARNAH